MTRYETAIPTANEPAKTDLLLWLVPLILCGLGILMVTSTTSGSVYDASGSPFAVGIRQFGWLGIGFAMMLLMLCIPTRFWRRAAAVLWIFCVALLVLTLIPGIGQAVGGARRWLRIAGVSIQTSEIVMFAAVFETEKLFDKHSGDTQRCFATVLLLIAITAALMLMQPDLGSAILLIIICMGMFIERHGWKFPLGMALLFVLVIFLLIKIEPYRMRRLNAFLDPYSDPLNSGFQTIQGLIAFANGGIWGSGLGYGFQKLQYLPAAYTDFIYAALGEELGLLGTLGILALVALWMSRCYAVYRQANNAHEASLVWGFALTIFAPFFINVGGVTNLIPLTGMPLPFVSYGGSSLVMSWIRIGILLRIQRDIAKGSAS